MTRVRRLRSLALIAGLGLYWAIATAKPAYAMHIMEGFLPPFWAMFWWVVYWLLTYSQEELKLLNFKL